MILHVEGEGDLEEDLEWLEGSVLDLPIGKVDCSRVTDFLLENSQIVEHLQFIH